jgi:HAD superfamily hydrolase (TIGR01509 family)
VVRAVLFDLDGVIRHFHPEVVAAIEQRHGLAAGAIESFAFSSPVIESVTTGRITKAEWVRRIGDHIGAPEAAAEWGRQPSTPDQDVLDLIERLRGAGLTTAVLTNGTDGVPDEVFSSHEIGAAKPDVRAFRHVLTALRLDGPEVFFTDDSPAKLQGATELGMPVHHFTGVDGLRIALAEAGVRVG